jgi:hypothetical protein
VRQEAVRRDYCSKTLPGEKVADRSRITYACAGCAATAEFEKELKHDEGCKKKQIKKVCSKSGTPRTRPSRSSSMAIRLLLVAPSSGVSCASPRSDPKNPSMPAGG